ncbi:hypothetical protein K469DRAFT_744388 [Zopfia rhizophila CBS 207.26]|uniref:L-ornithine N(5)-oxygenase n=1 Tax=Zopfia rhizophila CBS 207.26 TaxID=1314779 RepID=A0A6A6ETE5_9PEZI|nr:hypothetical protein K469DRAFT_744388 [Zopfia rhizophila CBS 207.26]
MERRWKEQGMWHIRIEVGGNVYRAPNVIDASGQTSIPNISQIPGADTFKDRLIHHKDFGSSEILRTSKRCVVIGGAKSAAGMAYAFEKAGSGPAAYFPPDSPISYYRNSNEWAHSRFLATLTANIFTPDSLWTAFVNRTRIGRAFLRFFLGFAQKEMHGRVNYDREDGKENGFPNLKPDTDLFWQNDSSGISHRPDFWDTIANRVKVNRQNVDQIGINDVVLADGTSIEIDAIIYATGWRASTPYIEPSTAYSLGLATKLSAEELQEAEKWRILEQNADSRIIKLFPILA